MDFPIRETIEKRRSVRTYAPRPLSPEDRGKLTAYAGEIDNPFGVPVRIGLQGAFERQESCVSGAPEGWRYLFSWVMKES